jgi:hypothetical protein
MPTLKLQKTKKKFLNLTWAIITVVRGMQDDDKSKKQL